MSGSDSCWASTNHGNLLSTSYVGPTLLQHRKMPASLVSCILSSFTQFVLSVRLHRLDAILFSDEPFQRPNCDRRVDLPATASVLTGRRAYTSANRREWIRRAGGKI